MAEERSPILRVWVDAQLPPAMAGWLAAEPGVEAQHTFAIGLLGASDQQIWDAARDERVIVVSKDSDFVDLVQRHGPPPQIVWVTTGNATNTVLRELVRVAWPRAIPLLQAGEPLVELRGRDW
jgi:predicted nuclease of predicted toxin-antitoxin system